MLFLEKRMGNYMKDWRGPCPALPPSCPALSTSPQTTGFFLRIPLPQSKRQKPIYNKHSSRIELNGLTHFLPSLRLILQKRWFQRNAKITGLSSVSTLHCYTHKLVTMGLLPPVCTGHPERRTELRQAVCVTFQRVPKQVFNDFSYLVTFKMTTDKSTSVEIH